MCASLILVCADMEILNIGNIETFVQIWTLGCVWEA